MFCLHVCAPVPASIPGTGVVDGYEQPYECWELNPGPWQKLMFILGESYRAWGSGLLFLVARVGTEMEQKSG